MEEVIAVKDLSFSYGGSLVINNLSFSVHKGDFVAVIGQNGTGKSTLIKLLLGLLPPLLGHVEVLGNNIKDKPDFSHVAYVAQKAGAFNSDFPATVREVVQSALYNRRGWLHRIGQAERAFAEICLAQVGIMELAQRPIGRLSGGQQQRAFIARALAQKPVLMLLDEPTVGVDITSVSEIGKLLGRLNREQGITIMMVTHDYESIRGATSHILDFGDGTTAAFKGLEEC